MIEEYLNNKVESLVKQMWMCEEERKSLLLELITMENTSNNSGSGGNLTNVCKALKNIVENIVVTVQNTHNDNRETCEPEKERRKCRYFNRGFCKYGDSCAYFHPSTICEEYLRESICLRERCEERHPKHCRYWSNSPEGCRYKSCKYLHVVSEKYCEMDQESTSSDVDEQSSGNCEIRGNTNNKARETDMTPKSKSRGNLFSCDQGHDGCANATCHDEHMREMDEKRRELEKIISKYETPGDIDRVSEIDQEEIERICQKYEYAEI